MEIMQNIFNLLNINRVPNGGDVSGFISVFFLSLIVVLQFLSARKKPSSKISVHEITEPVKEAKKEIAVEPAPRVEVVKKVEVPKLSWSERLTKGLSRTRQDVWGKIGSILSKEKISNDDLDSIEEILYTADLSSQLVSELIESFKKEISSGEFTFEKFKRFVHGHISNTMAPIQKNINPDLLDGKKQDKTKVIMIVGVNGAGKTTTIGKLATRLKASGATVVVGACDTFRAAAIEQLEVWANRAGVELIKAKHGADPSGVAYDTLAKALSIKADYCILDTAGRLHTNEGLMEELKKTKRVLSKLDDSAPHETLLVVDAITGQNAIKQAEEFNKALKLTGLIFTKCDGSAKAGSAVSIVKSLSVPIAYIGVGEDVEDLDKFELNAYLNALLGAI